MLYVLLSIGCSLATASVIKVAGVRALHPPSLLTANYAAATFVSALLLIPGTTGTSVDWSPGLVTLSVLAGGVFIAGFFALTAATRMAGMSLSVAVMRASAIISVLASWLIWRETPTPWQAVGLALAAISFFGLAHREEGFGPARPARGATPALALVFLMGGLADVSLKAFTEMYGTAIPMAVFMTIVFCVAGVLGAAWLFFSRETVSGSVRLRSWLWGIVLGLANLGSVSFMLSAVNRLPGPVVFPLNNAGIMLGATVLGIAVWSERLTRPNRIGLALALAAIVLLGL